uniref:Uncharacterized protein n=1 Tax=Glossina palpalis gambiensis TaxID=67801 RepID=A0A1B0AZA5_9MUSC
MFCFVSEFAKESSNERETTCRYHYHFGEICNCACVFKPKRLLMRRQRKRLEIVDENIYLISLYHDEIQCILVKMAYLGILLLVKPSSNFLV